MAACALGRRARRRVRAARAPPRGGAASAGATVAPAVRAVAERLAAQDRVADARLLAAVRPYAGATARDVTPRGSQVERLVVTVTNRGRRELHGVDGRLRLYRARDARRLGLATFHADGRRGAGPQRQRAGGDPAAALSPRGPDGSRKRPARPSWSSSS